MPLLTDALAPAKLYGKVSLHNFWNTPLKATVAAPELQRKFIEFSEDAPVQPNVIFYETMSGARMGDNPYGIFEYLRAHPEVGNFLHVWSVGPQGSIPERYQNEPNVIFVQRDTAAYAYFLATAKYVICNANLPEFFARRPEQRYLNTWHGIPFKALGRNTPKAKFGSPVGTNTFTKSTHLLSPCAFTTEKFLGAYSMRGVSRTLISETGYPRIDRTINLSTSERDEIRKTLGILSTSASSPRRPVVLFAPTWRAEGGKDTFDEEQLLGDLEAMAAIDADVLYRGHHRTDRLLKDASVQARLKNIITPPHEISTNDLLTVVDVLVTDFSSVFFDFLPTGRPIVHYLYDFEEYSATRGVYLKVDELPGAIAYSRDEMSAAIALEVEKLQAAGVGNDFAEAPLQGDHYASAQARFCAHEDGHASQRAVEFFFSDHPTDATQAALADGLPSVAFWAGDLRPGPKAAAFTAALLASARKKTERTVLITERSAAFDKPTLSSIRALGNEISTVSYEPKPIIMREEEEGAYLRFAELPYLSPDTVQKQLATMPGAYRVFEREYRRRFDDARFDKVVVGGDLSNDDLALASFATTGTVVSLRGSALPLGESSSGSLKLGTELRELSATNDSIRKQLEQANRSIARLEGLWPIRTWMRWSARRHSKK